MLVTVERGGDTMPEDARLVHLAIGTAVTAGAAARGALRLMTRLPGMSGPIDTIARRGERTVVAATVVADALLRATVVKIVAAALDEIDLTRLIRENVDIDAIIEGVDLDRAVAQVDLDKAVARVDIEAVVDGVDLDRQVSRVDLDAAIGRVDLIALANFVIDGVDLPEIIRESTGSLSAEAVRGVRSQGMQADDAVTQFVGRLFGRDGRPST